MIHVFFWGQHADYRHLLQTTTSKEYQTEPQEGARTCNTNMKRSYNIRLTDYYDHYLGLDLAYYHHHHLNLGNDHHHHLSFRDNDHHNLGFRNHYYYYLGFDLTDNDDVHF